MRWPSVGWKAPMTAIMKRTKVLNIAAELFLRHGFGRTTMSDIARTARMSRPALYLLFPDKETVFEAAVLHLNEGRMAEIREAVRGLGGLADRLYAACDLWLVVIFALQRTTPDARDMDDLSFPVVRQVYAEFQELLSELIEGAVARPKAVLAPSILARNLTFAVRGFGATAADEDDLRQMVRLQIDLVCGALKAAKALSV